MIALHLIRDAPVAQLDRALVSGTRGQEFKSPQARHNSLIYQREFLLHTPFDLQLGKTWEN
jgi:hypothetical protein